MSQNEIKKPTIKSRGRETVYQTVYECEIDNKIEYERNTFTFSHCLRLDISKEYSETSNNKKENFFFFPPKVELSGLLNINAFISLFR